MALEGTHRRAAESSALALSVKIASNFTTNLELISGVVRHSDQAKSIFKGVSGNGEELDI
jgi:hypothetical protein